MAYAILTIYLISMTGIALYCLLQLTLALHYIRDRRRNSNFITLEISEDELPFVTIQLPVFNERYVVQRLIECCTQINYPQDKFEIHILDDSTDDTGAIIQNLLPQYLSNNFNLIHITRQNRTGYKAGALQEALSAANGEFIAIFDADFLPPADFLIKTIPFFKDEKIGVVQTRWEHLNRNYSLLTQLQAFAIDVHFSVEQRGRNAAGYFINFNGTAGIWRKSCIEDAGGWSADTLTEDLDLSYRAQLKGWKFKFMEDLGSPAELPAEMKGYRSQQFRWNKGGAETAKKIIPQLLKNEKSISKKIHGFSHLLNSSVYVCVFIAIIASLPLLYYIHTYFGSGIYIYLSVFLSASVATALLFFIALYSSIGKKGRTILHFSYIFPLFISFNIGMSLHNALAVIKGFAGIKTAFIRTPKFNLMSKKDPWKQKNYNPRKLEIIVLFEIFLALYFTGGIILAFYFKNYALLPVHLLAATGFTAVVFYSLTHTYYSK